MPKQDNRIKVNYIFSILYQLLTVILPIITTPYISRRLGVANVGYYSHVTSIVSYFMLFANLGTYTYGRREIGSYQKNREEYSKMFWNIFAAKIILGLIVLTVFSVFVLIREDFQILLWIETFMILSQMFDISWFFQGLENYKITVTFQMAIKTLGVLSIFIFVKTPEDLSKYTFIMSFLAFAGAISIYPFVKKYVNKPLIEFSLIWRHICGSFLLFIPQIAASLYMSIDKTMIGNFFEDGIQNGLYEQATKIDQLGLHVVIALTGVMIPRISLYFNENDMESIRSISTTALRYIMFIGCPLAFGISGIGYNVLPWFLGPGFEQSSDILQITAFIVIVMGITNFLGYGYLVATRQQKIYTITVFTGTIINVIVNSILIPRFGGIGAAMASLFSEMIVLILQIIILRNQLQLRYAFKGTYRYILLAAVMGVAVRLLSIRLSSSIIHSLVIVIISALIYIIPLAIIKDRHIESLKNNFKGVLAKFKKYKI